MSPIQNGRWRPRIRVSAAALGVGTLAAVLTVASDEWLRPELGWIDTWLYLGFMLDLPGQLEAFGHTYYASRLAWLVPGYLTHSVLPPLAANLALRMGVFAVATLSLYATLEATIASRSASLLATILLASCVSFLEAVGWDYVDGPGIAYWLLSLALLVRGARRVNAAPWMGAAGAAFGAMVHTNLFLLTFSPLIAWCYVRLGGRQNLRAVGRDVGLFLGGAGALTVALGLVSLSLGGPFWFFLSSIKFSVWSLSWLGQPHPFSRTWLAWVADASWSPLIWGGLLLAGAMLATRPNPGEPAWASSVRRFWQWHFIAAAATMAGWELVGQATLQYRYYASFLVAPMFLAVGAQLAECLEELGPRLRVIGSCLVLTAWLGTLTARKLLGGPIAFDGWLLVAGLTAPAVLVVLGWLGDWRAGAALALYLGMGVWNGAALGTREIPRSSTDLRGTPVASRASEYRAIVEGFRWIQPWVRDEKPLMMWYDVNETGAGEARPLGYVFRAIASTHGWGNHLLNEQLPTLEYTWHGTRPKLDSSHRLIILTARRDLVDGALAALTRSGLTPLIREAHSLRVDTETIELVVVEFLPPPSTLRSASTGGARAQ